MFKERNMIYIYIFRYNQMTDRLNAFITDSNDRTYYYICVSYKFVLIHNCLPSNVTVTVISCVISSLICKQNNNIKFVSNFSFTFIIIQ